MVRQKVVVMVTVASNTLGQSCQFSAVIGCFKRWFTEHRLTFHAPCLAHFGDLILFLMTDALRLAKQIHEDTQKESCAAKQEQLILSLPYFFICLSVTFTVTSFFFFSPSSPLFSDAHNIQTNNDTWRTAPYAAVIIQIQCCHSHRVPLIAWVVLCTSCRCNVLFLM